MQIQEKLSKERIALETALKDKEESLCFKSLLGNSLVFLHLFVYDIGKN
jgi:hypothetical protein